MENFNFDKLDSLLGKLDVDKIDPEGNDSYSDLPDGYYLCEVEKAELKTTKSSGEPMVSLTMKVVEDGLGLVVDEKGYSTFELINKTKGRKIFINFVLSDEQKCYRFANDMVKFEGDEIGKPILDKEAFLSSATLLDALDIIEGLNIYVNVSTKKNNTTGELKTWQSIISWKRAKAIGLIEE